MKLNFAGFVRGLFRQHDDNDAERHVAPPSPAVAYTPEPQEMVEVAPEENSEAVVSTTETNLDTIDLPLAPIIACLPMDLRAKLMNHPQMGQTISLSAETVVAQLAFGAVKISFGELRRLAPGIFANSGGEHDNRPVSLPLQEILVRMNPALLSRRSSSKVEVSEEVAGPFDGRGRGVTFTSQPLKAPVAAPTPPLVPAPRGITPTPAPAPEAESFSFTQRQVTPSAPIAFTPPTPPTPPQAKPALTLKPTPTVPPTGTPAMGNGAGNGHGTSNQTLPPFKFSAAPASPAAVASSAPRPEPAQPTISAPPLVVALDDLADNWPDALKNEIVTTLANASVPLPMSVVEPGLKKGRVTMTWRELRLLARPSSAPSANDGLTLELPLKVLAPAFLAAQKKLLRPQSKVAVSGEIPNLFFGFPQSSAAPVAGAAPTPTPAPVLPMPASIASTAPVVPVAAIPAAALATGTATARELTPAPAPVPARPAETSFFSQAEVAEPLRMAPATDFMSRQAHPKDLVAKAATLPGVAGAVVALADGLRVASEVSSDLNPDTVAAFLPQIYERVNQCTRELRMGSLNNVSFTVGNVPWKIFRINSIYFAAFGRAGEMFPKSQLAALAAELDRKK